MEEGLTAEAIGKILEDNEMVKEHVKDVFTLFDVDKNGYLEKTELVKYMHQIFTKLALPEPDTETIYKAFDQTDTNHDHRISQEEMLPLVKKMLTFTKTVLQPK